MHNTNQSQISDPETTSNFDVESQNSLPSTLKRVPTGFIIPEDRISGFIEKYKCEPISQRQTNGSLPINYHPFLAFERNLLERKILRANRKSGFSTMDVGGSPARVFKPKEKLVRCLIPILQPGDEGRRRGYEGNPRVCYHTLQQYLENIEFSHQERCGNCVPVDALMLVHSAYYIPPECYLKAFQLGVKEIHVIGLLFPEITGKLAEYKNTKGVTCHEATYVYDQGVITMRVMGNSHTYLHKKLPWDGRSTFTVNNRVITAVLIEKLGDTHWWKLELEPETVVPIPTSDSREWDSILLDEDHHGDIQIPDVVTKTTQSMVRLTEITFRLDRLQGDGKNLLVWGSDEIALTIPRGAVAHVANNLVYRERTPALLASATYYSRGYISTTALPIERQAHAIAATAILGMSVNVVVESRLLNHAANHQSAWWRTHAQLLSFAPVKVYSIYTILAVAVVLVGIDLTTDYFIKTPNHMIALIGLLIVGFMFILLCLLYWYKRYVIETTTQGWINELKAKRRASYTDVSTYVPPPLTLPPNNNYKTPKEQDSTFKVVVKPDPKPPKNPGKVSERIHLEGISASDIVPSVVYGDQKAEEAGVRGRMALQTPPVTQKGMDMLKQACNSGEFLICFKGPDAIKVKDDDRHFKIWLARDAIPKNRKAEYAQIREEIAGTGIKPKDTEMRTFVKVEKRLDTTLDGVDAVTPRMISNPSDRHKVATGSFLWHFTNKLGQRWNGYVLDHVPPGGRPMGPVYTRGMTAEAIGKLVNDYLGGELFKKLAVIENDGEKFDAHIKDEMNKIIDGFFESSGANPVTMQAFAAEVTKAISRHGVKLTGKKRILFSGINATNVKGTIANVMIHVAFLQHIRLLVWKYLMLVLGDDNTTFLPDTYVDNLPDETEIIEVFREMGFTMTPLIRKYLWDVEFCNKIFLPCSGGLVLSPKPGRTMAKLSWSISDQANLKGTCISMRMDAAHVPFLRVFLRLTMDLIDPSTKAKFDKFQEYQFHVKSSYEADDRTWEFIRQRYGLGPEDEKQFEIELSQVKQLPAVVTSSYISLMEAIDAGKPLPVKRV